MISMFISWRDAAEAHMLVLWCTSVHTATPHRSSVFVCSGRSLGGVLLTSRFKCSSGTSHSLRDESWGKADNRS